LMRFLEPAPRHQPKIRRRRNEQSTTAMRFDGTGK
jgi:hypothetical protein